MAEASIEQHSYYSCRVTEYPAASLNLKIEDNLNEYIILIVGKHDQGNLFKNLLMIISEDRLKAFDDIEKTLRFIDSTHNANFFLIISGTLGETNAHKFDAIPQIICLYVYCMNTDIHAKWTKEIRKIRCIVSETTQLFIRLHADIKQLSVRWPFGQKSFQKAEKSTSEWYHLFLLAVSHQPQCIEESYREMLDECRIYYNHNKSMLKRIDYFAQHCNSYNAILEYTRSSFVYSITNHALRTQNMELIMKFSPFITRLNFQLHENYTKYCTSKICPIRVVYRGQALSVDELEYLRSVWKSKHPVITLTTFCSASLDFDVAMRFLPSSNDHISCLFEIIITDEYTIEEKDPWHVLHAFANISSLSFFPAEQEVLFSLLTHFRVKDIGAPIVQTDIRWVPITLELISAEKEKYGYSHLNFLKRIKTENNSQNYAYILNVLKEVTEDEVRFNNMDWKKWWSIFERQWGTDAARDQPLVITLYQCFTEHKYYSRKAVEIHKNILLSVPSVESNRSSFPDLRKAFESYSNIPTKQIALYEQYLKQFCTTNTKESIECLYYAGLTYEKISDNDRALECYETILILDESNKFHQNYKIQQRIKNLKKPSKADRMMNNGGKTVVKDTDKESSRMHEVQQMQGSIYRNIKSNTVNKPSIASRLKRLLQYLNDREAWYDAADSKIILRLSYENTPDLSVNDYRSHFFPAVVRHLSSSFTTTDATNNICLSLWRYEKYMHEWTLFKSLENFLQPFKKRSECINKCILPKLERFLKKLSVLITVCTIYICVQQRTGKINVNKVQFTSFTKTTTRQLSFFDLHDGDLLNDLEELEEKSSVAKETSITIPDHERFVSMTPADFIETVCWV
ncbi:unnamed protein product [Rotaria magnacalcarata]|uniref:Uncharacterized protein n=1 Tax=Rotaria magnacalcarata TaxID=392030 RepID=A0A816BCC5_9BILA|nr:unnamed protein product [Rotaria magnacalcarata]CAF1608609.1 unnamed protein product [Rotaria magnacalcarata]CAF4146329.1 unnamed protein product [Rotaria magnacalcarata]CAF4174240.1 unnamed protein product [Rotaria magnacalcarata]